MQKATQKAVQVFQRQFGKSKAPGRHAPQVLFCVYTVNSKQKGDLL